MALDDYVTDDVKSKILEGSTSAFEFDGKLYSVPMFSWYMTLFCNKTMFDKAGATLPTTYDELVDAVKKLKKLDGVTPMAAGAKDGWNAAFVYQALALREVGATGVNEMLSPTLDKDKIIVVNVSGRGDKDVAAIARYRGVDIYE